VANVGSSGFIEIYQRNGNLINQSIGESSTTNDLDISVMQEETGATVDRAANATRTELSPAVVKVSDSTSRAPRKALLATKRDKYC
jgi:hypothetical protein